MLHRSLARVLALLATTACAACSGGALPGAAVPAAGTTAGIARSAATDVSHHLRSTDPVSATIAMAGERFNAVPGDRFNAIPGLPSPTPSPSTSTCGDRFNAVPGTSYVTTTGGCSSSTAPKKPQPPPGTGTKLCAKAGPGSASCNVSRLSTVTPNADPNAATVYGWRAADLQAAYNTPSLQQGAGAVVAIVDAYDDPAAEADLAVYRTHMGLPPCTTHNGCFIKTGVIAGGKADPKNGASLPRADTGWAAEIALDTQMVSAICPLCKIALVEANSASFTDLQTAVRFAAQFHPIAISNSYYAPEYGLTGTDPSVYAQSGITYTAAAGDDGFGATYPADVPNVVAVAGTTLLPDNSLRGFNETVWDSTGSGCSTMFAKPLWQDDRGCGGRTIADVAVVGDPRTGVAFYTSYAPAGVATGWEVGGGTSAGAPIVAAMYALAQSGGGPQALWKNRGLLLPITEGSNGTCSIAYLCTATGAYSGPAGNGAPWGVGAFR